MSMHIVDDEQRGDRPQPPCGWPAARPSSLWVPAARGHLPAAGRSAALALLDNVHGHCLRPAALQLPPRRSERGRP